MPEFTVRLPGGLPNKNGRVYPTDVLRKAVADAQERVKARRMIGEIDPPGDGRSRISSASHVVTDLRMEEDGSVKADVEFFDNEAGRLAMEAFRVGYPLSMSTRASGTVDGRGVVSDMKILGVDIAHGPKPFPPSAIDLLGALAEDKEDDEDLATSTGE